MLVPTRIRPCLTAGLVLLAVLVFACGGDAELPSGLEGRLERVRREFGLPAVAGGYVTASGEIVTAVTGVRRIDRPETATPDDLFHLGSVTKPFTATLAAVLAREGLISFEATIGETLASLVPGMHPDHRATTLGQLLRHRAGLDPFEQDTAWAEVPELQGPPAARRRDLVRWLLARPPRLEPGSEHVYSNAGYAVAALMLEQAAGATYEDLLALHLLRPLGVMHHALGWPVESGLPAAWGHRYRDGALVPHDPADDGYRLSDLGIGPAGDLSLTIDGLARFARLHLLGLAGHDDLLAAQAITALHEPLPGDDYALGWNVRPDRSTHLGSAETMFAAVYLMRERGIALVVATNAWSPDEEDFGAALLRAVLDTAKAEGVTPE